MKIVCVGGGPAGLSFATLMKMRDQAHEITVLERNPAGSAYGWGITYWQPLLDKLVDIDPHLANEIRESSFCWSGSLVDLEGTQTASHRAQRIEYQSSERWSTFWQSVQQNSELTSSTSTMWRTHLNCLKPI